MTTIPISDGDPKNTYTAAAAQTVFPYTFWVREEGDIDVYVNSTLQALATDYTVSAVQSATGANIVFNSGLSEDDVVVMVASPEFKRETDYTGTIRLEALNTELAYMLTLAQSNQRKIDDAMRTADSESVAFSGELPALTGNGSKLLSLKSDLSGIEYVTAGTASIEDGDVTTSKLNDLAVTEAKIATDAVTSAKIASNAVGNSELADNAVDLAEMAHGTQGDVLYYGASGEPLRLGAGTSGQVLQTGGAGANPSWVNAASGGMVLLGSYTASNVTSVDIGSGLDLNAAIDGTYDVYVIKFVEVVPASDPASFYLLTSSDTGSTFDTGATDYEYTFDGSVASGGTIDVRASTGNTEVQLATTVGGGTSEGGISGQVILYKPSGANFSIGSASVSYNTGGASVGHYNGSFKRDSAADVDGIRFLMSSGNITSGTFYLYGIRKS
jgi:hypothetical protein